MTGPLLAPPEPIGLAPLDAGALRDASRATSPWTPEQLTQLVVANVIGLAIVVAGVFETTGDDVVRTRMSWLEFSILGLLVAGVANGMWLLRTRRNLALARRLVLDPAHRACLQAAEHRPDVRSEHTLVAGIGMSRFHRATCHLVTGKDVVTRPRAGHERRGLAPCEVCRP